MRDNGEVITSKRHRFKNDTHKLINQIFNSSK